VGFLAGLAAAIIGSAAVASALVVRWASRAPVAALREN
jgi:hypothetical protein